MSTDPVSTRLPVDILTKSNWRQFFTYLQLWLESKGLFYICKIIIEDYCPWHYIQGQKLTNKEEKKPGEL